MSYHRSSSGSPEGHTRRRTPGLRREEVALLADVSLTWYTWLEQGREVSASADVLERISDALRLTPAEREYLLLLTGRYASRPRDVSEYRLTPAFRYLVDTTPYPFFVIGPRNRLIAWNAIAGEILTDFAAIPAEERIMLKLSFLHPAYRAKVVNWEQSTKIALSFFRKSYDLSASEAWYTDLVKELKKQSKEFCEWWTLHEVADKNGMTVEIRHPGMGDLHFEIITFNQINDLDHLMCCIYSPIPGTQTAEKLAAWHNGLAMTTRL
ncbi:helix-turn-helix transcriptional regulator [Paenibacillus sp. P26]|nr:helix-turn-helix transcriptional regulator [Paenibacillus sp. P26]